MPFASHVLAPAPFPDATRKAPSNRRPAAWIWAAAVLLAAPSLRAQTYQLEMLPPLHNYDVVVEAQGMSETGVVVGRDQPTNGNPSFIVTWRNGVVTALKDPAKQSYYQAGISPGATHVVVSQAENRSALWLPGGSLVPLAALDATSPPDSACACAALAVNDQGQAIGYAMQGGQPFAVLWNGAGAAPTVLPSPPQAEFVSAFRLTNSGWGLGRWSKAGGESRPLVWKDGLAQDLSSFKGLQFVNLQAVNESGLVVGSYQHASGYAAALSWQGGVVTKLPKLKNQNCLATAVSDAGAIVGTCEGVGVLWKADKVMQLSNHLSEADQAAGWYVATPLAINSAGVILANVLNRHTNLPRPVQALLKPVN